MLVRASQAERPKRGSSGAQRSRGAKAFADFVVSKQGQELIGKFGVDTLGAPLFTPDAGKPPSAVGL